MPEPRRNHMARALAGIALALILTTAACFNTDDDFYAPKNPATLCAVPCGESAPDITGERIVEVFDKHRSLFERQPGYNAYVAGIHLLDENWERSDVLGLEILVERVLDQGTLPPEDRIPDCLDGVPIQIIEETKPTF